MAPLVELMDVESRAAPSKTVLWIDQVRHILLLLQLQRPYLLCCLACAFLATVASAATLVDLVDFHRRGVLFDDRQWVDVLEGRTWQSMCWFVVSVMLCAEVSFSIFIRGSPCNSWCMLDMIVLTLTVVAWALTRLLHASPMREEAEEADLWLLAMRFMLQPCRILSSARTAWKLQQMQQSDLDINFDMLNVGRSRAE